MNVRGELSSTGGDADDAAEGAADAPGTQPPPLPWCRETTVLGTPCRENFTVTLAGTDIPWQPITIADIASFVPQQPDLAMEPGGWAVRGLHTNFVSSASTHVVPGTLLGRPAEVRFTPISWTWTYGDGSARTSRTGGSSWSSLGIDRFEPTTTSHVYRQRGSVAVSVRIDYAAEYRFNGAAWSRVVGTLPVSSPEQPLLVVTESTVLVDGSCGLARAIGC